jgi:hypothetical protein
VVRRGRALLLAAGLAFPAGLAAQNPPSAPGPPARADTALAGPRAPLRPDSGAVPDSLSPDSFSAVLPPLGPPSGPLPRGMRLVFDRDALAMSGAFTLGELLRQVPGAFLVRAGWYGLPEVVHLAGQGASSVELFWDGYAIDPLGEDSAGVDVGRIPLGLFRRVEVEVLPTVLRVHLVSDTQPVRHARTETSFGTGDAATNNYRIRYLNRWRGGLGAGLGVNWFGTTGQPSTPARSSDLTLWAKGTWAPSTRTGVEWQYVRYSLDRAELEAVLPGRRLWRSDHFLRAFAASRPDGMGFRFDALVGASSSGDSSAAPARTIAQGAAFAGFQAQRWSAQAGLRVRDARVPLELQARVGATPLRFLTIGASAIARSVLGGRTSRELAAAATARVLGPVQLRGSVRLRDVVAWSAVLADTAQRVTDWSMGAALVTRRLDLDAGLERHGAYAAPVYGSLAGLVPSGTSQAVRTVTVAFALRPKPYFTLSGWYREPLVTATSGGVGTAAYEPPHHTRVEATFRSRFLPTFRRGALDVLVQVSAEGWGDGMMGADSTGAPLALDGHGTVDWLVELRLLSAVIYWSLGNSQLERYQTVPGALLARAGQRYGVRWEFAN